MPHQNQAASESTQETFNPYDELLRSIPEAEKASVLSELDSDIVARRAEILLTELSTEKKTERLTATLVGLQLEQSRLLFLAALRNVRDNQISSPQLASLHILDSAIRTLYTSLHASLIHEFVEKNTLQRSTFIYPVQEQERMPTSIPRYPYTAIAEPDSINDISELPWRMQKPVMARFFNFTDSEWHHFCQNMQHAPLSEQSFHLLVAPAEGCWSGMITKIQKVLTCMRTLEVFVDSENGLVEVKMMPAPSFSMFQAAINAKAKTLNRNPVSLVATYGYIDPEHYAELKATGQLALAMYFPEKEENFRTTIDGHAYETAFAGAIHDVYHAFRELAMSENVAKARMYMADIARQHPQNKMSLDQPAIDDVLVDGELIHSYPPELDTMFNLDYRSPTAQLFGDIFYERTIKLNLHEDLKHNLIKDMVVKQDFWQTAFGLGRMDLRAVDQAMYDEIKQNQFSPAAAIGTLGLLSNRAGAENSDSLLLTSP
ncbi:MAG: hypothetical protein QNK11_00385 [Legionella sp.]|nr:hypothetical protein [Legionella sp.]